MSLAIDLTNCQSRLAESGRGASAAVRKLKGLVPPAVFDELMLRHCEIAAECTQFKMLLGVMRMTGEMEQRPPEVTTESLELSGYIPRAMVFPDVDTASQFAAKHLVPMLPHDPVHDESELFRRELERSSDDTLTGEVRR